MNTGRYVVLINIERGTPSVVSTNTLKYPEMMATGFYSEHFTGTKAECEAEQETLLSELIGE